jgi:hypothetical protein
MTIQKINAGRGHWYKVDGVKADGVTTLIGDGMPKPALIGWAANTTAAYAVDHWDDLSADAPSKRLETLKRARYMELDTAARRGTEVHGLAERLSHGEEIDVPEELAGHVESAIRFLDEWNPKVVATETVVASRKWRYAGTFDLLAELPDGRRALMDYKTSRSGIFGETALQLGAYANADAYLDADGKEFPMADLGIDCGMAVWIRADGYDVYEVDLEQGFKIFQHVAWVARQAKGMKDALISQALLVPGVVS